MLELLFSIGLGQDLGLSCPNGFTNFIDKCVWIPSSLPTVSTYGGAVATCQAAGRQVLTVSSLYLLEGIRTYLKKSAATADLWIGSVAGQFRSSKTKF